MDWDQFPAMIFQISEPNPEPQDAIDCAIALSDILFSRLHSIRERTRAFVKEKAASGSDVEPVDRNHDLEGPYKLKSVYDELAEKLDWNISLASMCNKHDVDRYIPQPLFGALSLVIRRKEVDPRVLVACDAADLPVWIVRTGIETGLSAPINFDELPNKANQEHETVDTIRKHAIRTTRGYLPVASHLKERVLLSVGTVGNGAADASYPVP